VSTSSCESGNSSAPKKNANPAAKKSLRISRREFGLDAAAAAAGALALSASPTSLGAALRDRHKISPAIPGDEQETAASKLTAEQSRDVEAKLANIIRKYGERLSEEQRKHLRKILAYNETMLDPIRAFALQNGDPPVTVLKLSSGENKEC
jgi:hypothetical protein